MPAKTTIWRFVLVLIPVAILSLPHTANSEEAVTNAKLYEMLGSQAHSLMKDQLENLQNILDGFWVGDWFKIQRGTKEMTGNIHRTVDKFKTSGTPADIPPELDALQKIAKHVELLESYADAGDYEKSFSHFYGVVYQCIKCHQAKRSWGRFDESAESLAAEGAKKKSKGGKKTDGAIVKTSYEDDGT